MLKHIDSIEEFRSLLDYYISCLEKEDTLSLTFDYKFEGKKFHSNIFKKEQLFLEKKEQIIVKKTPEIENIFKNYKLLQKNMPIFYGYPLFMDSQGKISPIFFVEIIFEEKEDTIIFTKESVTPEFNHHILTKHGYSVEEIVFLSRLSNSVIFSSLMIKLSSSSISKRILFISSTLQSCLIKI